MRKIDSILKNLPKPQVIGPKDADLTFITWGSTYCVVQDAIRMLEKEGMSVNHLSIKYLCPFQSKEISAILKSCKRQLIVEANFTGQLERLIRQETGLSIENSLRKYDGEPFGPNMVYQKAKQVLSQKRSAELVNA